MNISEVIKKLEEIKKQYGDLEVFYLQHMSGECWDEELKEDNFNIFDRVDKANETKIDKYLSLY